MGEFGRRWTAAATVASTVTPHSDIDSDYRRELATNGLHQEARSRDGGGAAGLFGGRLSRGSSKTNIRSTADEADVILRSTTDLERSNSNSAREEERRKVLEIEGVIRQPPRVSTVSRSASRYVLSTEMQSAHRR